MPRCARTELAIELCGVQREACDQRVTIGVLIFDFVAATGLSTNATAASEAELRQLMKQMSEPPSEDKSDALGVSIERLGWQQ